MQNYILFFLIIGFTNLFGTAADHISLIQSSIDNGDYLAANEKFETAITEYDGNAGLYFIGGRIAVKLDMLDDANKLGADAIINVRFTTSMVMQGASEMLAYGTAVKLK